MTQALLSVSTMPSDDGKDIVIQVSIMKFDGVVTIVYSGRHPAGTVAGGIERLPGHLLSPCEHNFRFVGGAGYSCTHCGLYREHAPVKP